MSSKITKSYLIEKLGYRIHQTSSKLFTVLLSKDNCSIAIFSGNKKRVQHTKHCQNQFDTELWLDMILESQYFVELAIENRKKQEKILADKNRLEIQPGDIFNTHWGYDNTYVDFFQVIRKVSPTRVIIRELHKVVNDEKSTNFTSYIKPLIDNFSGEEKRVSIDKHGNLNKADEYGHKAFKTKNPDTWTYSSWGN